MKRELTLGLEPGPFIKVRVTPGDNSGFDIDLDDITDERVRRAVEQQGIWTHIALMSYLCGRKAPLARLEAIEQQFGFIERLMRGELDS